MQITATRKLRRLPTFLGRVADAFPGGVAYLDSSLVFTFCNEVQASYFGRSVDTVLGRHLYDVVQCNPEYWGPLERVVQTGERLSQTSLAVRWWDRPDEGTHHFIATYAPYRVPRGGGRGVFMTAIEVTQPVPIEIQDRHRLQERNRTLEQMLREKDILLGIISHEIRTPLTTIFGNAHLLLRRLEDLDADSRMRAIGDIRQEAERLNQLVENMLLLARAGAQAPVPTEPVLLGKALASAVDMHKDRSNNRCFVVSVKPKGLMADAQPDYINQVIQNLVSNADKYSPHDQPIDVRARRTGRNITVSILDRGPGIAKAESEIVFQPFYRSGRTSTTVGGAGIGLAVCKLLVHAQSGQIWTRPRRGGGSVFAFTVPALAA